MIADVMDWIGTQRLKFKSRGVTMGHALAIAIVAVYGLIFWSGSFESLPATVFSTGTLIFAYYAYKFSREKFRLDLFDKRFAIYEAALTFCSAVSTHGSFRATSPEDQAAVEATIKAAEGCFRGVGLHKSRALFGEDIKELFDQLNKSYSWLRSFSRGPDSMSHEEWAMRYSKEETFIWNTVQKLPDLFKAYMYFGDYKR